MPFSLTFLAHIRWQVLKCRVHDGVQYQPKTRRFVAGIIAYGIINVIICQIAAEGQFIWLPVNIWCVIDVVMCIESDGKFAGFILKNAYFGGSDTKPQLVQTHAFLKNANTLADVSCKLGSARF